MKNLLKSYDVCKKNGQRSKVWAVNNLSIQIGKGECHGLLGESGSGKSTLSRLILGLEKPDIGEVIFLGRNIFLMKERERKKIRKEMQIVFQDSYSSLNPRMKIYDSIAEPIRSFESISYQEERKKVAFLLARVGLSERDGPKYPHQFSGGQQKRICIARAIATSPKLIILDEAVSGLDAIIKKKILDLLIELKKEMHSSYLVITHDLEVAWYMSQKISVMKDGAIVETVGKINSLEDFKHPYSRLLISFLPPTFLPEKQRLKRTMGK
ncbi:dipeptide/oligopeptide/nickel ABC transporter ATP-binding protein [Desulforamulus ruminis]|uniref:ABC transporter ATP-binding protein n=1 Tax=Desulforamulus ruminis TaxID=1564 RepID=UPI002FDA8B3F